MRLPRSRLGLLGLALVVTLAIVIVSNAATDLALGRVPLADGTLGFIDAPDVFVLDLLFTGLPFIVLALVRSSARRLWSIAFALTVAFGIYAVVQIRLDSLGSFAGGANIGLGLIMLASPFVILAVVGVAALFRSERTR
ncbi:MAG TPA: hypothetical protein VD887_05385 [Allosphingosinicella sp.]|nr:hypothetical protein [Allosphingosinicella sp.]